MTSRLAVERLTFGYPGRVVGRDVSFTLAGGEVMCLLGPNGGGKTTMFKTILGLLEPMGGTVSVDGTPTAGWSRAQRGRTFGYVPQAAAGVFPYTVREIVLMGRTARVGLFATPSRHDREAADGAIATLGIEHLADRPYTDVSGGERQLALVARALAQEPSVLVMDEPTASLDFGNQVRVLAEVQTLAARGIGVILSTHDPDQVFLCADRVAVLHRGGLVHLGTPAEVLSAATLREVYGVEVTVHEVDLPDGRRTRMCLPTLSGATTIRRA